jgi:WXG100 family type VII secretion target
MNEKGIKMKLDPQTAPIMLQQIDDAHKTAVNDLNRVRDTQEQMLAAAWQGGSATSYRNAAMKLDDDFNAVIQTLNDTVDLTNGHIKSFIHADNQ